MTLAVLALTGCATGENVAGDTVEHIAAELTADLDSPVSRVRDAEWLAATHITSLNSEAGGRGPAVYADTLGVPGERERIVGVRGADGVVEFASFDPTWIEPGELGCSTRLVTSPPT